MFQNVEFHHGAFVLNMGNYGNTLIKYNIESYWIIKILAHDKAVAIMCSNAIRSKDCG